MAVPSPSVAQAGPDALTATVDAVMAQTMPSLRVPGAAVVIVKDGRVVLLKGYGVAGLTDGPPVDPATSVFHIASVSKAFTALTALTYVESGRLSLEADVRQYLRSRFRSLRAPVTLGQLLTHTSGLDDEEIGDAARTADDVEALEPYLARRLPPLVLSPGAAVKYSNHGVALAGLVIEAASGVPFEVAVQRAVFEPLGMHHSSFAQRPVGHEVTPHERRGDVPVALTPYFVRPTPAYGMTTTAEDVSRFLLAATARAEPATPLARALRAMQLTRVRTHPRIPGVTHGLFEATQNGERALYHEGGMNGFTSFLLLVPDQQLGLFVVQNLRDGDLRRALTTAVIDHYIPRAQPPPVSALAGANLAEYAGTYRFNRTYYPHSVMKVLALLGAVDEVVVAADGGGVQVDGYPGVLIDRDLVGSSTSPVRTAFVRRGDHVTGLTLSVTPLATYDRIAWFEQAAWHRVALSVACLVLAAVASVPRMRRAAPYLIPATSLAHVGCLATLVAAFATAADQLQFGPPPLLTVAVGLAAVSAALTAWLVFATVEAWRRGGAGGVSVGAVMASIAALVTCALMAYWRVLGVWF